MKRLLVLRHAKAGPHDEKHDKERALTSRGREDAARMGSAMRERHYLPDLVLCSSARRTVDTWESAAPMLKAQPETQFLDVLYDAPAGVILKCVRTVRQNASVLLVIGHNPGLEDFARQLTRRPTDAEESRCKTLLNEKFPTSALAVVDFGVNGWAEIVWSIGILREFLTPAGAKTD